MQTNLKMFLMEFIIFTKLEAEGLHFYQNYSSLQVFFKIFA